MQGVCLSGQCLLGEIHEKICIETKGIIFAIQMLKQLGVQKEQRALLRTALRSLASTCWQEQISHNSRINDSRIRCAPKNRGSRQIKKMPKMFAREQKKEIEGKTAMSSSLLVYFLHSCRNLFIILNIVIFSHHTSSTNQNRPSITFLSQRFTVENPDAQGRDHFPVFARH